VRLQVTQNLATLAKLPGLKTINLHGCTAASQAADVALNKLLKAIKANKLARIKVVILRKDVDYTLHDSDDTDLSDAD
jgi:hypothetical protein